MNKHEKRILKTFLELFEIEDVKKYLAYLNYLYGLAGDQLIKIVQEWTDRYYRETNGAEPSWWEENLSPFEVQNLQKLWNFNQHYSITGQASLAIETHALAQLTRYEALQKQVEFERMKLSYQESKSLGELLPKAYERQYQHHLFNIGKEIGSFQVDFNRFDPMELKILAAKSFPDGRSFKDIIFAHNQVYLPNRVRKLVESKVEVLAKGLVTGSSPLQMGRELSELNSVSLREAVTLMNDELGLINNESNLMAYKENSTKSYIYIATLETGTCVTCRNLDQQEFLVEDAVVGLNFPLIHSHCRCTTKAKTIFTGQGSGTRWSRDSSGKGVYVSGHLTFEEWLKQIYYND